ncbi:DUF3307 domain-containing protein [Sporosarcina gallistercoris]|uniref:DUF3307 domain-containing protein n=1 Tax=Sporosarcina gallistercoris TaxID=2762245 RepID=A0ABR8PF04_9BACL|nr:DUF3307 domain-containing protein [Sporosarcina gallistercoris]MBD7906742.1 DUF3307 domain-containing protein [Sporosarcina gallistercoris]
MTLFSYLIVGHLIGDYLLQTRWMAAGKATKWAPLITHCFIYTSVVSVAFLMNSGMIPISAVVLIFVSHVILDRRRFVAWWAKTIMGLKDEEPAWLLIIADQIFHIIVLALIAHIWG